jgi:BirA family biotin operon repressor/biotin-[acetyl-CoA-carboxylase] ligase
MSVLLRPELDAEKASTMTLAAAVGVADALREKTDLDIWLKWPNDLYIGDRKVAGLLTEAQTGQDGLEAVVAGLGVNVNVEQEDVPDELTSIMTSLRIEGGEKFDRMGLAIELRRAILDRCGAFARNGMASIQPALETYDQISGRPVEVRRQEDWVDGVARGIDEQGKLKVEIDGEMHRMGAGEVQFP